MTRKLSMIAMDARNDWVNCRKSPAWPYLDAMKHLDTIDDKYFEDSARSIVNYFLANAGTWRGETARQIKAELKAMLKKA